MNRRTMILAALATVTCAQPASAHHSAAMFDATRTVTLTGVVKAFQWTNPHSWLRVAVSGPGGQVVEWSVELTSPNLLARSGWRPSTIKPGERVTITAAPLRDGSPGGQFRKAVFPDGRVLTYDSITGPTYPAAGPRNGDRKQ